MSKEVWNGTAEGQTQTNQPPPPAYTEEPGSSQPPPPQQQQQQQQQQPPQYQQAQYQPTQSQAPPQQLQQPAQQPYSGGAYTMAAAPGGAPMYTAQPQGPTPVYYGQQQPVVYMQPPLVMQQTQYYQPDVPVLVRGGAACKRCGVVYPLPSGATSWRCKSCSEYNNIQGDQCAIQ